MAIEAKTQTPLQLTASLREERSLYLMDVKIASERHKNHASPEGLTLIYTMRRSSDGTILQQNRIALSSAMVIKNADGFELTLEIQKIVVSDVYFDVVVNDDKTGGSASLRLASSKTAADPSLKIIRLSPSQDSFFRLGDTVSFQTSAEWVFVYRFKDPRPYAPPPFLVKVNSHESLDVDSMLVLRPGEPLALNHKALYFAQIDTTGQQGVPITVVSRDFPKPRVVNNLAEAMVYISDDEEFNRLTRSDYRKKVMDEHWLSYCGTESNARKLIASYYKRMTYANQNFTSIREGWRTDRGMIYMIFGEPLEINEVYGQSVWTYYSATLQKRFSFTFTKVQTPFSDNHYVLQNREAKYLTFWKLAVNGWRSGSDKIN